MGATFDSNYNTQNPVLYSVDRKIDTGSEEVIAENGNWLAGRKLVPIVTQMWHTWINTFTAADGATYWTVGAWRRRVQKDFSHYVCVIRVKNLNNTNSGRVQFKVVSSGTTAVITVAANQAETTASIDIAIDPSQTHETIEMAILDPTGGNSEKVYIQSVSIYTKPLSSPLTASVFNSGFAPIDESEVEADRPLTTYLRTQQLANSDAIYKTRVPGTVLSFSENFDARDATDPDDEEMDDWLYVVNSTSYKWIATIPVFDIPEHCTRLGVAVLIGVKTTDAAGTLKITTESGVTWESSAFNTVYTFGGSNSALWQTTANAITVKPGTTEHLKIYLKGDNDSGHDEFVFLAGLNIWMEDCT